MSRKSRKHHLAHKLSPMVILPAHSDVMPEQHEFEIAWILARHYTTVIEFLRPTEGYKVKTADFVMNGLIWELKSPTGKSRTTVSNQFKRASKQSSHVIFDSRRIKIDEKEVLKQVHRELQARKSIKAVLFITKTGTVIEIQPVQW